MTGLIIAMTVLAAIVGLVLARPLWRRNIPPAARAEYDLTVFRDQLKEIERDAEGGLLDKDAAEAARVEVQRRMLAADEELRRTAAAEDKTAPTRAGLGAVLIAAACLWRRRPCMWSWGRPISPISLSPPATSPPNSPPSKLHGKPLRKPRSNPPSSKPRSRT